MLQAFFVFFFGASLGSFLAVWAERGSLKKAAKGRSHCGNCTMTLKGHHLIPVISWLGLRGRCGHCKRHLSFTYLLFEAGLGFAFVLLWAHHFGFGLGVLEADGLAWSLFLRDLVFTLALALLFAYDLFRQTLPDRITLPAVVIAFVWNLLLGFDIRDLLLGALVVGGFFALQFFISRGRWIGGGDIRMGVLLGVLLGLAGGVEALFLAYIFGAGVAIVMLLSGVATRKTMIPFGTFLALGGYIVLLWGEEILSRITF
ncbi:TPA: hypothetical protein DDZ10_03340 [Candidatus Uhrbacteria bacterium]|nr:MAG: hypothetical protein A3D69_03040 [Candidatus Uhrbacteria bacterium RIFCSPHIGHO2_02_FULL_54_11]HBL39677.1 hypothetical protein [Candidatus Uhrbacteria bacterium]